MDERRRLKLLPEVLPAPPVGRSEAGPRARTREHMQRLLAAAAISGVLACSKTDPGYGVVDPMPTPADTSGPPPQPSNNGGADASKVAPEPMPTQTGYAVVDPLPQPPPRVDAGTDAGKKGQKK